MLTLLSKDRNKSDYFTIHSRESILKRVPQFHYVWGGGSGGVTNGRDCNILVLVSFNCQLESSERKALIGEQPCRARGHGYGVMS